MTQYISEIKKVTSQDTAIGALYLTITTAMVADIIPQPLDALYFYYEKDIRDKWMRGELTPKQYWTRKAISYYGIDPLWWAIVLGAVVLTKGDVKDKLTIAGGVIGAGAVIGLLFKFINKDVREIKSGKIDFSTNTQ